MNNDKQLTEWHSEEINKKTVFSFVAIEQSAIKPLYNMCVYLCVCAVCRLCGNFTMNEQSETPVIFVVVGHSAYKTAQFNWYVQSTKALDMKINSNSCNYFTFFFVMFFCLYFSLFSLL